MSERDFDVIKEDGAAPVKMWTRGVPVEDAARQQLVNVSKMPFIFRHVAVMPDVHWGMGATIGSVIPTKGAIIPAAVGVDIGCGMMALKTTLTANDLPDNLHELRLSIESHVPHGRTDNGGPNDRGAWGDTPRFVEEKYKPLSKRVDSIFAKNPALAGRWDHGRISRHLGTLGGGNHFVEICLDENNDVWVMLHSGSRGFGNAIGRSFIELAKQDMKQWFCNVPDEDLAYLPEGTEHFDDYMEAIGFAQDFAAENRRVMMNNVLLSMQKHFDKFQIGVIEEAVNCHHNYVEKENHFGSNVWVTRKGAVRARENDLGIIPGSMGAKSFIVRGKGNKESFCSCSHGAGRSMSRKEAERRFSIEDHIQATEGVECKKDASVIDETPMAYKDIDAVMAAQSDLVEVVHTLKQVLCVKG